MYVKQNAMLFSLAIGPTVYSTALMISASVSWRTLPRVSSLARMRRKLKKEAASCVVRPAYSPDVGGRI